MTFALDPAEVHPARGPFDLGRIGAGLVFRSALGELAAALRAGGPTGAAVVQAPPGTGKTTLVPPLLANLVPVLKETPNSGNSPRVVVTQPRRIAARSAARRLASLDGSGLGDRIGYTVRGERRSGRNTLIEFVTPGILLQRLLADPGLEKVDAVILDEVHERGLDTDLLLGLLGEVRQLRNDLILVAMSATLDTSRFAALLDHDGAVPAPVVDCPSALHPLALDWTPAKAPRLDTRGVTSAFLQHVADTTAAEHAKALKEGPDIDALVFLPGVREVSLVAAQLRDITAPGTEILELHGQAASAAQDRAVSGRVPGGPPRIVVSTSLAESALTVPGVRLVVDSGLSREPRRDSTRGMAGLVTVSCSRSAAEQRAGRAARQGPGRVVRCYDQKTFAAAPAHPTPEILAADLTGAALVLACWGAPGGRGLRLADTPPQVAMEAAAEVLRELGATAEDGLATEFGKTLARIPADPRLARALLDGAVVVGPRTAAEAVALVAGEQRAPGADLVRLLGELRAGRGQGAARWADDVRRMEAIARQGRSWEEHSRATASSPMHFPSDPSPGPVEAVGRVVALAFPDRVARRVPDAFGEQYLLSSGTRAGLPAGSGLSGHEWLAVAEVSRAEGREAAGTGAVIRSAAPLTGEQAESAASVLLEETEDTRYSQGRISARRDRRLGAILLSSTPVRPQADQARAAVAAALEKEGLGSIGWSADATALRRRLALLFRVLGEPWPDVSDAALLSCLDAWLGPELDAVANGASIERIELADPLRRLLPWPEAARLAELVPERLEVPSGSRVRIDYPEVEDDDGPPVVAVKLQECFGWAQAPRIVDGKVPVLFHLLSPAGRPLAVTDDLASFWSGPYAQVRAEMRGRYPKHPWPEDPWTALATARTKGPARTTATAQTKDR